MPKVMDFTQKDQIYIDNLVSDFSHDTLAGLYEPHLEADVYEVLEVFDDREAALKITDTQERDLMLSFIAPNTQTNCNNIYARNIIRMLVTAEAYRGIRLGRQIASELLTVPEILLG